MTVGEIINYNGAIKSIIDTAEDVNSLVKFKLLGMAKQFEQIATNYESIRNEKIKKYGSTHEDGRVGIFIPVRSDFENDEDFQAALDEYNSTVEKFSKEMDKILNSESELEIKKFKYTDIIDAGIPADYLVALYDLIEE